MIFRTSLLYSLKWMHILFRWMRFQGDNFNTMIHYKWNILIPFEAMGKWQPFKFYFCFSFQQVVPLHIEYVCVHGLTFINDWISHLVEYNVVGNAVILYYVVSVNTLHSLVGIKQKPKNNQQIKWIEAICNMQITSIMLIILFKTYFNLLCTIARCSEK